MGIHSDLEEFLGPVPLNVFPHHLQTSSGEHTVERRQTPAYVCIMEMIITQRRLSERFTVREMVLQT